MPDFGAGKTFDFEPNRNNGNGWSVLLDSISGKCK